jgi:hypothetical protein
MGGLLLNQFYLVFKLRDSLAQFFYDYILGSPMVLDSLWQLVVHIPQDCFTSGHFAGALAHLDHNASAG